MFRAQARRNKETHDCSTLLMAHAHAQLMPNCSEHARLPTAQQMHSCALLNTCTAAHCSTAQDMHNRPLLNACTNLYKLLKTNTRWGRITACKKHTASQTQQPMYDTSAHNQHLLPANEQVPDCVHCCQKLSFMPLHPNGIAKELFHR